MNDKIRSLASEIINEIEDEKREILTELECLDADFDKARFILNEAIESIEQMGVPETKEESLTLHCNIHNAGMKLSIAFEYVVKLQNIIGDIVIIESRRRKETQEKAKWTTGR